MKNSYSELEEISSFLFSNFSLFSSLTPNSSLLTPNSEYEYEFFIQYLVSKNNYKADNAVFKGHTPTKVLNENNLYKYLIGPFDVNTVFTKRNEITKNFPDAFIVAYKEGKKVSTPEAIQEAKDKLK